MDSFIQISFIHSFRCFIVLVEMACIILIFKESCSIKYS